MCANNGFLKQNHVVTNKSNVPSINYPLIELVKLVGLIKIACLKNQFMNLNQQVWIHYGLNS